MNEQPHCDYVTPEEADLLFPGSMEKLAAYLSVLVGDTVTPEVFNNAELKVDGSGTMWYYDGVFYDPKDNKWIRAHNWDREK